jgi:putative cell wall-binding protein
MNLRKRLISVALSCVFILSGVATTKGEVKADMALTSNDALIMGTQAATAVQMAAYSLSINPAPKINCTMLELAKMFLEEGAIEGVRGDIAFAQACKETGYFAYGGTALPEWNNYSGLGVTGIRYDPNTCTEKVFTNGVVVIKDTLGNSVGVKFSEPRLGVRAQIQHLKGYAATAALKQAIVDPRYYLVSKGIAPHWVDLNGKWAVPGTTYGQDILAIYGKIIGFSNTNVAQVLTVLSGTNRYATAVEISKASYSASNTVILASGINFPDALSAGPLAIQESAPILLTETNSIPQETLDEIIRLKAAKVIILGGEGAVGSAVAATLNNRGISVARVSGSNRFGTAVETAKRVRAKSGVTDKVILANGYGFADALSIGSYASKNGIPILLTNSTALSSETKAALKAFGIKEVQIIGGYIVISQSVEDELKSMGIIVTRTYGSNRFETSAKAAGKFFPVSQKAVVTNGRNFADALSAVPLAAKLSAPIILVEQNSIPMEVSTYMTASSISSIIVVGGDDVIGQTVKDQLVNLMK